MKDFEQHILKLRKSGLRPTKQRLMISTVLFDKKNTFHFTIENLYKIFKKKFNENISLATIYNTIHVFKKKGYLKAIALQGNKTYYDTNTSAHHHFYDEDNDELIDIEDNAISLNNLPSAPNNKTIKGLEVIIKVANDTQKQK